MTTTATSGTSAIPAGLLKPAATNRSCFGTLYFNPYDLEALKIVAAAELLRVSLHLEEVKDRSAPVLFVVSGSGETLQVGLGVYSSGFFS